MRHPDVGHSGDGLVRRCCREDGFAGQGPQGQETWAASLASTLILWYLGGPPRYHGKFLWYLGAPASTLTRAGGGGRLFCVVDFYMGRWCGPFVRCAVVLDFGGGKWCWAPVAILLSESGTEQF